MQQGPVVQKILPYQGTQSKNGTLDRTFDENAFNTEEIPDHVITLERLEHESVNTDGLKEFDNILRDVLDMDETFSNSGHGCGTWASSFDVNLLEESIYDMNEPYETSSDPNKSNESSITAVEVLNQGEIVTPQLPDQMTKVTPNFNIQPALREPTCHISYVSTSYIEQGQVALIEVDHQHVSQNLERIQHEMKTQVS